MEEGKPKRTSEAPSISSAMTSCHLAQQVVEAGASRFGGQVLGLIVHVLVPVDEDAVPQVDEFGPADARMRTRTLGHPALGPAVPPPPSLPAQHGAGPGGPGAHIMNMAMGTRTLSRMRYKFLCG